jgi:predicted nuclease of restriction endonuclease-like RecB superfamily
MPKYKIIYGIFEENEEIIEAKNQEEAERMAYEFAVEVYESYEGLHGIRSEDDILNEEENITIEDAYDIYKEEVENTIFYSAEEI